MTDPIDDALGRAGDDPTPAFQSGLESLLGRAYDGESISTARPTAKPARRVLAVSAAAAVVAASVIGAVVLFRHDGDEHTVVDVPPPVTTAVPDTAPGTTSDTGPSTSVSTVPSSIPPSTASSSTTTTVGPTTTTLSPAAVVTIDLTSPSPELQPTVIASFPITPPGDLFATAFAAPAGDDRIAVLDDVTGVVRFVDAATGAELSRYPTDLPVIGSQEVLVDLFVGPDDVLYANVAGGNAAGLTLIAYGRNGDHYVEVARVPHTSMETNVELGPTGVGRIGSVTEPIMDYVDNAGVPSGATLPIDGIVAGPDASTFGRGSRMWTVQHVDSPDTPPAEHLGCEVCDVGRLGPHDTVVLRHNAPQPDGDIRFKFTVLGDTFTSYDTDWMYVGALGDLLLFSHLDQDSIDIGTVAL